MLYFKGNLIVFLIFIMIFFYISYILYYNFKVILYCYKRLNYLIEIYEKYVIIYIIFY